MVCLSFVAVVAKTTPFVAWLIATILFVHKSCVYLLAMRFFLLILFARLFSFFSSTTRTRTTIAAAATLQFFLGLCLFSIFAVVVGRCGIL